MPPADQNPDLQSAFSFLILIARFVILEVMKVKSHATPMHHQMIMVSSAIRLAGD